MTIYIYEGFFFSVSAESRTQSNAYGLFATFDRKIIEEDEMRNPQKGERVDSIAYYSNMLDLYNDRVERMQKEANDVVEEGNRGVNATEWIASVLTKTTDVAASSLVSNLLHFSYHNLRLIC